MEEGSGNGPFLSKGALLGEPGGGGGCFTGDCERYVKGGSGNGPRHRGPFGEPGRGLINQGF